MTPVVSSTVTTPTKEEPTAAPPTPAEYTHSDIFYRRLQNGRARDKEGGGLIILEP